MPAVRRLHRPLIALLLLASGLLLATGCGAARADLEVTSAPLARPVPEGFVGLSMEYKGLALFAGSNPRAVDPVFLNLVRQIAPDQSPVLRVGGDSTDWSWYPAKGLKQPLGSPYALTPTYMAVAKATARALGARYIMGVNLEANSRAIASAMANGIVKGVGARYLDALELGNEPELYTAFNWYKLPNGRGVLGRPKGYSFDDYLHDFAKVLPGLPDVPIAGPGIGEPPWLAFLGQFLRTFPRVKLTTIHAYALKHCTASHIITIPELLANAAQYGFAQRVAPYVSVAHANGKRIRIDEMNAITCGGMPGVSDSYASSLWALNTLFELTRTSVDGVNIHANPGKINEILGPSFAKGRWSIRVDPEYYGMIMFAQAAPPGSQLMRLSARSPSQVHTWATKAPNGDVRVVVVNERARTPIKMRIRIPGVKGNGSLERLRGPRLSAPNGTTLGGLSFGSATTTGKLAGKQALFTVEPSDNVYTITLPAASAALLSVSPSGTAPLPAGLSR